jgi:electron transport complex protein RnfD
MLQVLAALAPGAVAHVWYFGPGLIFNLLVACIFAVAGEALVMWLRGRPPESALSDYSALVTAALLAFALPAMAGYVVILVAFPIHLNLWIAPRMGDLDYQHLTVVQTLLFTLTGSLPDALGFDAISRATPLDTMKTGLANLDTVNEIRTNPLMGDFGGRGWEWIGNFLAIGGFWLMIRGIVRWHIPAGVGLGLLGPATLMYLVDSSTNPGPGFHLFAGASILCAFFIATDPVSAAASPKGRFTYGVGIGLLIYAIRTWGSYADGVAFAVLIMNMTVPVIDYMTRPRIVGHRVRSEAGG